MSKKLKHLSGLLNQIDPELYKQLEMFEMNNLYFCHEWLILNFKRCFSSTHEYQRCFEMISSHYVSFQFIILFIKHKLLFNQKKVELHTLALKNVSVNDLYSFDLFICLALLKQMRNDFLQKATSETDIFEILRSNNSLLSRNLIKTFQLAEEIFEKYCLKTHNLNDDEEMKNLPQNFTAKIRKLSEMIFN